MDHHTTFESKKRTTEKEEMKEIEIAVEEIAKESVEENGGRLEIK
ncbi:hypothetical protein [Pelagicoccus enzymogenes]|nr:hypothetical protein [Pelagicoccus enzymogenes]